MELHSYRDLPAHLTRSQRYVPDVVWFIASTRHAVVLVFRGADPFFQVRNAVCVHCHSLLPWLAAARPLAITTR